MTTHKLPDVVRDAVLRADTPYILFADDIALHFRLERGHALTAIRFGLLGPWFLVEGEPAVLRETLKEHLRLRMAQRSERDKELLDRSRMPASNAAEVARP